MGNSDNIIKGNNVRIYPTKNQQAILNQAMGNCRHIWNETLRQIKEAEKNRKEGERVPIYDIINQVSGQIPDMKKNPDTQWLNDSISSSLGWELRYHKEAWKRYFDNLKKGKIQEWRDSYVRWQKAKGREIKQDKIADMGKPKFKRKGNGGSCSFHQNWVIVLPVVGKGGKKLPIKELRKKAIEYFERELQHPMPVIELIKTASRNQICKIGVINMPSPKTKTKQLRGVPAIFHREIEGEISTCTVSRKPSGKYEASIRTKCNEKNPVKPMVDEKNTVGFHNGLKMFVTDDGAVEVAKSKFLLRKNLDRLKYLQRRLSNKFEKNGKERSRRWHQARIQVAKLHERIASQREYYLHSISNQIVNNPKYQTICVEDWDKKEMMKDPYFAQAIQDVSWEKLITYIKYKSDWKGKNVLELPPHAPSAKTCSNCEHINEWVELRHRVWKCENCGKEHKREVNCAKNTKRMALQRYFEEA